MLRKMMYVFLGLAGATAIACSSPMPTSQESSRPAYEVVGQVGTYLKGKGNSGTLSSCTDVSDSASAVIDANGGIISLGGVTLAFPPNALSQSTTITMVPVAGSQAVRFYPEGLQFPSNHQPMLSFDTDCIGNPTNAVIVYTDDSGLILENEGGRSGNNGHSIWANIAHFSQYAVDW